MKQQRPNKLSRLFDHLKHIIHADHGGTVRRRDLLSTRQGEIQLELDFEEPKGHLSRKKWLDMPLIERSPLR